MAAAAAAGPDAEEAVGKAPMVGEASAEPDVDSPSVGHPVGCGAGTAAVAEACCSSAGSGDLVAVEVSDSEKAEACCRLRRSAGNGGPVVAEAPASEKACGLALQPNSMVVEGVAEGTGEPIM